MKGLRVFAACAALFASSLFAVNASAGCCEPDPCCTPAPVCCPPPPVETTFCAVDPCTGCKYPVTVCVDACCAGEIPCYVGCRSGWFGRKILTYKFTCSNKCVDVVITKHGRVIVRD